MPFIEIILEYKTKIKAFVKSLKEGYSSKKNLDGIVSSLDELIEQRRYSSDILSPPSTKVVGFGSGSYRSPFRGRGMEFDEVRLYQAGDDVRTIDWRVTARTGKAHTKLFHEEKERPVYIVVDLRPPMRFGTRGAFKSVVAARLASMVGWSALAKGDRIGGLIISSLKNREFKPQRSRKQLMGILKTISEGTSDSGSKTGEFLSKSIISLRKTVRTGSLVFIFSDFSDYDEELKRQLSLLASNSDLVCVHISDVLEEEAPPAGIYRISDGKEVSVINSNDEKWCQAYEEVFAKKAEEIKKFCHQKRISYIKIRTDSPNYSDDLRKGLYSQKRRAVSSASMREGGL